MNRKLSVVVAMAGMQLAAVGSTQAATILSTDFDGRTLTTTNVTDDTATNLNWSINGVADLGDMVAYQSDGLTGQNLFNNNAFNQNLFAPLINTGNGNTIWRTFIPLTVSAGKAVTLSDVVFDYAALNSSGNLNVDRRSDFLVTLFNPSGVAMDQVVITDALSGTNAGIPTVTATFSSPIALSLPGTYKLEIAGGDFPGFGTDETGNHTGIDNLSINGDVQNVPEPTSLALLGLGGLMLVRRRR